MDWRDQSLPHSRSSWTELGEHFFVCFVSLLPLSFAYGFVLFTLIPRLDLGAAIVVIACVYFGIGYHFLCSTHHSLYWCEILSPNSQQLEPTVGHRSELV